MRGLVSRWSIVALSLGLLQACSSKSDIREASTEGHLEKLVILGTNDIHGTLAPLEMKTREAPGVPSVAYRMGGAAQLGAYIQSAREEYGSNLIWLDGGDQFQGTLESNTEEGKPMVEFFNKAGLTAAAVGNHEFDFGPVGPEGAEGDLRGALKARVTEAKYAFLSANLFGENGHTLPLGPQVKPSMLVETGRGLKVGIIGLSTVHTPVTTRPDFVKGLEFQELREVTLRESQSLKSQGAEVIVAVAHAGLFCKTLPGNEALKLRAPNDPQGPCEPGHEIIDLLHAIPEGTLDAVVSGHTHSVVHHYVAGVPVIQAGSRGQNFNLIHLAYDREQKKLIQEETRIEGPIAVCEMHFENQGNCDGNAPPPSEGRGKLVSAQFHGRSLQTPEPIQDFLKPLFEKYDAIKAQVIAFADNEIIHNRASESPLGNLVSDALRAKARSDFAIVNSGGIRAPLDQGEITFGEVYTTLPFDNFVTVLKVSKKELINILKVAQSAPTSVFPVSNLQLRLLSPTRQAPFTDLNGNGEAESWEYNRLVGQVTDGNGKELVDGKTYTLAIPDFLVQGGDNMGWPMAKIKPDQISYTGYGMMRDALSEYIQGKHINSREAPLLDPKRPRIQIVE